MRMSDILDNQVAQLTDAMLPVFRGRDPIVHAKKLGVVIFEQSLSRTSISVAN